jgi:hypothetical protein
LPSSPLEHNWLIKPGPISCNRIALSFFLLSTSASIASSRFTSSASIAPGLGASVSPIFSSSRIASRPLPFFIAFSTGDSAVSVVVVWASSP